MLRITHGIILLGACLLTISGPAGAATGPAAAENSRPPIIYPFSDDDCDRLACRADGSGFQVKTSEGNDIDIPISRSPYVTRDGTVVIFPGEAFVIEFPDAETRIGIPKFSSEEVSDQPPNTMTLVYELTAKDDEPITNLYLRQTSGKVVKLDALIASFTPQGLELSFTTTCPLKPGGWNQENWGGQYYAILLRNFRYLGENADLDCETPEGQ